RHADIHVARPNMTHGSKIGDQFDIDRHNRRSERRQLARWRQDRHRQRRSSLAADESQSGLIAAARINEKPESERAPASFVGLRPGRRYLALGPAIPTPPCRNTMVPSMSWLQP